MASFLACSMLLAACGPPETGSTGSTELTAEPRRTASYALTATIERPPTPHGGYPPIRYELTPSGRSWEALRRPLELPALDPGAGCPTTAAVDLAPELEPGLGDGPIYPVGFADRATAYLRNSDGEEWLQGDGSHTLILDWVAKSGYPGRVMVRGRKLDGEGDVEFRLEGGERGAELVLPEWGEYSHWRAPYGNDAETFGITLSGWQRWESHVFVRDPGCYGLQVDGPDFTDIVVFRVVNAAPPPTPAPRAVTEPPVPGWRIPHLVASRDSQSEYDSSYDLYLVDADGAGQQLIFDGSAHAGGTHVRSISLSPDGKRVAYARFVRGTWDVFVSGVGGGTGRNISRDDHWQYWFAWSPDSSRVAYEGADGLYIADADGGTPVLIPNTGHSFGGLAWSPDGREIAFSSGSRGIWIVRTDGSGLRHLTNGGGDPAWSPDGKRIAFGYTSGDDLDIYTINADGTGLNRLTDDPAMDGLPVWSPDGRHIAYLSNRDNASDAVVDLWVIGAQGGPSTRLTHTPVRKRR
jgi:TolB protein